MKGANIGALKMGLTLEVIHIQCFLEVSQSPGLDDLVHCLAVGRCWCLGKLPASAGLGCN